MPPRSAPTPIMEQAELIPYDRHCDDRGWFEVLADPSLAVKFAKRGVTWKQWNVSHSKKDVLRGLHYQSVPHQQAKLIRVVQGEIWDVVVDLRSESSMCGEWKSFVLSANHSESLYIPEGFAHGFLTLSREATLIYGVSHPYCPEAEKVIRWDDPEIGVQWPTSSPLLSDRDCNADYFH